MTQDELLSRIEALLISHVPRCVKAENIPEPVYSLRIWYHGSDTCGPDRTPGLMLPKESWRARKLAEKGDEAPHYIWCADELDGQGTSIWPEINDESLIGFCRQWYALRYSELDDGMTEAEALRPFREAMWRVCSRLNEVDWASLAAVTNGFVVFPADWSHAFVDDDAEIQASISRDRIELLRSRRLLGNARWWSLQQSD
jgi:hypothetical protein